MQNPVKLSLKVQVWVKRLLIKMFFHTPAVCVCVCVCVCEIVPLTSGEFQALGSVKATFVSIN